MEKVVRYFINQPLLVYLVSILIVAAGFMGLTGLNRQVFPDVSLQQINVETIYPAASARDVELNVTTPIEEKILEVDGIEKVRSFSMENYSLLMVTIDPDADDQDEVKSDIRRAVDQVTDLPEEIKERPNVYEIKTSWIPVIRLGLSSQKRSFEDLRQIAKRMEKDIEAISGVARVDKIGYKDREVRVLVQPQKLKKYYLSLQEIATAIKTRNIRLTGGTVESFSDETSVLTLAEFAETKDIGEVIVRSNFEGQRIVINDVAQVVDDYEETHFQYRANGLEGITLRVHKKASADAIQTVKDIEDYLKRIQPELPESLTIERVRDMAKMTGRSLDILRTNALIGFVLVVSILILFLNLRIAFWTAMGIPISLAVGILGHYWTGGSLDTIAITAFILVLGMLVDDAIVVAENIHRHEEEGMSRVQAAIAGVKEVAAPITATVSTTIVAFSPMFALGGMLGPFVTMIPIIVGGTLIGSLIESFFILPSHLSAGGHKIAKWTQRGAIIDPLFIPLRKLYRQGLEHVLRHRYWAILIMLSLLGGAFYVGINHVRFVLFPQDGAEAFLIHLETEAGTSFQATMKRTLKVEQLIKNLPEGELDSCETWIGTDTGMAGEDLRGDNFASIYIMLTPYVDRNRQAMEIIQDLREQAKAIEGFKTINFEIDSGGPPVGRAVELNILSENIETHKKIVQDLITYLKTIPGVVDPDTNLKYTKDEEIVHIDYVKLAQRGLSVMDVANTIRLAFEGDVVSSIRFKQEEVDIRIRLDEDSRKRKETLMGLIVRNQMGKLVHLKDFITLERKQALQGIRHYQGQRVVMVSADVDTKMITSGEANQKIKAYFDSIKQNYTDVRLVMGGEAEESAKTMKNMQKAGILAVLAVYFILVLLLNSLVQPLIILIAIPFGVIGVIMAFWFHGMTMGFLAMIGMLGMSGVVVNDSLIILSFINHLSKERHEAACCQHHTILDAAQMRLRPVMLTTLTTTVALLPTAYGFGGSDPFVIPMVMAMLWGIIFASTLTLFWVPTLFAIGQDIKARFHLKSRWEKDQVAMKPALGATTKPEEKPAKVLPEKAETNIKKVSRKKKVAKKAVKPKRSSR